MTVISKFSWDNHEYIIRVKYIESLEWEHLHGSDFLTIVTKNNRIQLTVRVDQEEKIAKARQIYRELEKDIQEIAQNDIVRYTPTFPLLISNTQPSYSITNIPEKDVKDIND